MPNYVFNELRIEGGFRDLDIFTDGNFDFNKIIPMPKELDIECGSRNDIGLYLLWKETKAEIKKGHNPTKNVLRLNMIEDAYRNTNCFRTDIEAQFKGRSINEGDVETFKNLGEKILNNFQKYGCCTWYDWCVEHWNTKWNAMDSYIADDELICFTTAWSPPENIVKELSVMCQGKNIELRWDGEIDSPGKMIYFNGNKIHEEYFACDE